MAYMHENDNDNDVFTLLYCRSKHKLHCHHLDPFRRLLAFQMKGGQAQLLCIQRCLVLAEICLDLILGTLLWKKVHLLFSKMQKGTDFGFVNVM